MSTDASLRDCPVFTMLRAGGVGVAGWGGGRVGGRGGRGGGRRWRGGKEEEG